MSATNGISKERVALREKMRQSIMESKLVTSGELFTAGDASRHLSCYKDKENPVKVTNDKARNLLVKMVDEGLIDHIPIGNRNYYRQHIPKTAHRVSLAWLPRPGVWAGSPNDKTIGVNR